MARRKSTTTPKAAQPAAVQAEIPDAAIDDGFDDSELPIGDGDDSDYPEDAATAGAPEAEANPKARLRRSIARALWRFDNIPGIPVADRQAHWQVNRVSYLDRASKLVKAMKEENIGAELRD